ncbi:MAG TPA: ABC transporter substrate-binding protein [Vineibacter sp.]|nr:ABC transporter substrate-binding protein [Vineibacter sp.]
MKHLTSRRRTLAGIGAAAASAALPRFAIAQADDRPSITIAVQQNTNTNTLTPLREQSNVGARMIYSFLEPLIDAKHQADLSPQPGLATEWRRVDDKTLDLKIRAGVKFHNGDPMTVEDVLFSFGPEHMFGNPDPKKQSGTMFATQPGAAGKEAPPEVQAIARRLWPKLERVEIVDKETVRFINGVPDVTLEGRIGRFGSEIVSRRSLLEAPDWLTWARRPVGTGPYRIAEFKPDTHLVLEAFDEYWGGRPPVKQIKFAVVPEVSSRVNGLLSGQYDFACDIPPDQIAVIEKSPRHHVVGGTITNHRLICFDKNHPQLADARIRRAMALAIDRKLIVDTLWGGRTAIPRGLQWEYYGRMFLADWPQPAYDPDQAAKLIKEAGYKGEPIPFRVLNNYYTNQVPTAQILTEMWRAVGLNVRIQMKENWQQIFEKNEPRAVRDWSNSAPFGDPVSSIVNQHGPSGQQQQVGEWTNPEFNQLSDELESSTDMDRRRAVFRRMLQIAEVEDPAFTVLHQNVIFYGKRKTIDWKPSALQYMDFRARNFRAVST